MAIGLFRCSTISKENELKEWEGWYGESDSKEPFMLVTVENDTLINLGLFEENGNTKSQLQGQFFTKSSDLDLKKIPAELGPAIPFIKSGIITDNFFLFKVSKGKYALFSSDYYAYIPLLHEGMPMKKMDPPSLMTSSDD